MSDVAEATNSYTLKLIVGNKKIPVQITPKGARLWLKYPFSKTLSEELKACMEGCRWHGYDEKPIKQWSIADSHHNKFQLEFLQGNNPYAAWKRPLIDATTKRTCYPHQVELFQHWMTYHYMIWAAEMGTGKTLAAIEGIEFVNPPSVWWIGPKSAIAAVKLEFRKWNSTVLPEFFTYEGLVKVLKDWQPGTRPPVMVVFDESSRCKTPTSQRAQAAQHLADSIRQTWGENGYVVEMSGSPAPKSPADWYSQCRIACPGYIKEGSMSKFTERLAITESSANITGGKYSRLVTWKDDVNKCDLCGQLKDHVDHTSDMSINPMAHPFVPSKNEIEALYRRMKGLVLVKFKKDLLGLPDKTYRQVICKPKPQTLNAARLIMSGAKSAATALIQLREISDGFMYQDKPVNVKHDACEGKGCDLCNNSGVIVTQERITVQVACPKEDALCDLLEEYDDVGRIVIYAGFTGSIDRVESVCQKLSWETIRVDGRGWKFSNGFTATPEDGLLRFQDRNVQDRIAFVGHPGSAGMGITLTASPAIIYYSNDFNAESRIQSEDRIHRPGMDLNLGATIIDLIHLPTDIKVLDNLQKKRDLQAMTLGDIKQAMDDTSIDDVEH